MHRLPLGAILLALLTASVPVRAQDFALLLGEHDRTLLITVHGDTVRARRGAGIVVPRASGWWRVGVDEPTIDYPEFRARLYPRWRADSIRQDSLDRVAREQPIEPDTATHADTVEEEPATNMHGEPLGQEACFAHVFWAAPLGSWPTLPPGGCPNGEEPSGEWDVTFVSPALLASYVGITTDVSYNFARDLVVVRLDSLARSPVSDMGVGSRDFEDEHDPRWGREAARCNRWYNANFMDDPDDPEPRDHIGTLIQRTPGRWRFERYYANMSYAGRGQVASCDLTIPVPASITGWDRLTVPLATLRKRFPKLLDAFTSPGSATGTGIAVVIDTSGYRVLRVTKGVLGGELGVVPKRPDLIMWDAAVTVMAQWATGPGAARWERDLANVLTEAVSVMSTPAPTHR